MKPLTIMSDPFHHYIHRSNNQWVKRKQRMLTRTEHNIQQAFQILNQNNSKPKQPNKRNWKSKRIRICMKGMKNENVCDDHSNQTWKSLPQLDVLGCNSPEKFLLKRLSASAQTPRLQNFSQSSMGSSPSSQRSLLLLTMLSPCSPETSSVFLGPPSQESPASQKPLRNQSPLQNLSNGLPKSKNLPLPPLKLPCFSPPAILCSLSAFSLWSTASQENLYHGNGSSPLPLLPHSPKENSNSLVLPSLFSK